MVIWKMLRLTKVEAESFGTGEMKSFDINMNVANVQKVKEDLKIDFTYRVDYGKEVGFLHFAGFLVVGGKPNELKDIQNHWSKKTLPAEFAAQLTNAVTFNCEVNGVLVTRVLNMPAPVIPPQISMKR